MRNQTRPAATVLAWASASALALTSMAYAQTDNAAQTQPGASQAQPATPQTQPGTESKPDANAPAKPEANVSDEKLDKTAAAIGQVVALKQTYAKKFQTAPEEDRAKVLEEAKIAMTKAVTDQGLSVEEYSNILQVAENDAAVRGKIIQRLHPNASDGEKGTNSDD